MKEFDAEYGDVKIFTLATGLEILGKIHSVTDDGFEVENALAVQMQPEVGENGQPTGGVRIGVSPLSAFAADGSTTGAADIFIHRSLIFAMPKVPGELAEQYMTLTGTIAVSPRGNIQVPR